MNNPKSGASKSVIVQALSQQFLARWEKGERPEIADYLENLDGPMRSSVFAELLNTEIGLRRKNGEFPLPKDYLSRFSDLREVIEKAFQALSETFTDSRLASQTPSMGSMEAATITTTPAGKLGKYEITGVLGKGGMGVVLSARDPLIRREVAIKQLGNAHSNQEQATMRLLQEARTAGSLQHSNIVSIYDVIQENENLYLVMEKVDGDNLGDLLFREKEGRLEWRKATEILIDCCDALEAAHHLGLIHRDIKPNNVMLTRNGRAKVLDFGLAKSDQVRNTAMTEAGTILGTPDFMSPEQFQGTGIDSRSDLYSLGATYYALLTGEPPFAGTGNHLKIMYAHVHSPVPRASARVSGIPAECDNFIQKAMAKDPHQRFASAAEMKHALQKILMITPQSAAQIERKPFHIQRKWIVAAALAGGLALISIASQFTPRQSVPPVPEPSLSQQEPSSDLPAVAPVDPGNSPVAAIPTTPLLFGATTSYSGPSKDIGQNIVLGIRTCFNAVNDQGGIHGRKLELVVLDDAYEPERALANMKELREERHVLGVIGNVGTPTARMTLPYALENRMLFFAPYSGAALLRQVPPDRYVFNFRASYADETAAMVNYFVDLRQIAPDKIAVFAQSDSYGDDGFHGVIRAMRKYQIHEQDILRVGYERNTMHLDDAVQKILDRGDDIEVIIMVPTYKPAARFIQRIKEQRPNMQFAAVSFVGSNSLAEEFRELGTTAGIGTIVTQVVPHYLSNSTGVIRYRTLLKQHFPEQQPGFTSLEGFIAAECLVDGLRKAPANATTEQIVDALESIHQLDLGIGPIVEFGPSRHQASNKVWGTQLNANGKFEIIDIE